MEVRKDTILFGVTLGVLIPFVMYAILLMINDSIDWSNLLKSLCGDNRFGNFRKFSEKLLAIMAICTNIIPFHYFRNKKMDFGLRGIVFPTVIYAMIWMSYFSESIFSG